MAVAEINRVLKGRRSRSARQWSQRESIKIRRGRKSCFCGKLGHAPLPVLPGAIAAC